ncbi:MAG TPA: four helix bundle protein [Desulfobacteraceae bacterium]|nr:four helix bundle protein [Desulfobacteraceae bacterium]
MLFGHEQLDVYQRSIDYVSWAHNLAKRLTGVDRHARDQLLRASQSIPLNIAEGNGRGTDADRRRFFEIARGSALECAAIQDCLAACDVLNDDENHKGKAMLVRIVSMLTKLGRYKPRMREDPAPYGRCDYDNDNDNDNDNQEKPRHEILPGSHYPHR